MLDFSTLPSVSIANLVLNFAVALVLSLNVSWYYEHYGQSLSNRRKFAKMLPVLTMTTTLVITIVKSSLALSLGLVGALSIVRFRTAIKEPEELMFLFIAITIGLGVGADQRWPTVVGVLILLGYMAVRMLLSRKPAASNLYLNIAVDDSAEQRSLFQQVNARLLTHISTLDFRRIDAHEGLLQLTYFLSCDDPQTLNDLIDDLKQHFPIREISFIQQERMLGG
ncbi:MAG TPA: DUF4956 domain-containing protein [Chloroflexi bacterium]|nr:DUF4956 domain-containing protein [Chloroflexota bacterium]